MNTQWQRVAGFTLIEVLVALLLLAVGALGAGAMALQARRAGQQSALLSAAVQLATTAGESMRANRPASTAADAANPYLQLDYDALADGPPAAANDCSVLLCDSAALAAADLAALRQALFERFSLGRIKICRDSAWWDSAAAALRWECNGAAGAPLVVKIGWRQRQAATGEVAGGAPVWVALPLVLGADGSAP